MSHSFALLPKVKDEIDRLLSLGVIEQVDEPTQWCAPIVVTSKAQGIRLCVDLPRLNETVMRERHVLPSVNQVLAQLAGVQVFSKLDCYNAFFTNSFGIRIASPDNFHNAILTILFLSSPPPPPWLKLYARDILKKMLVLLQGIEGVVCLIDDILVIGRYQQEHDRRLHAVLRRLQAANVTLNDKLEISVPKLKYVGYLVSAAGIKPNTKKIAAVINMAPPTNVTEVRCFLGIINQLAKFSPRLQNYQRLLENYYVKTEHGRRRDHKRRPSKKLKKLPALLRR